MSQATTWGVPLAADAPVGPETMASRMDDSVDALLSSHSGAARPSYAVNGTLWLDTDDGLLRLYNGTSDQIVPSLVTVPASAAATGTLGQWAQDDSYIYICTATDTWKRVAIATW